MLRLFLFSVRDSTLSLTPSTETTEHPLTHTHTHTVSPLSSLLLFLSILFFTVCCEDHTLYVGFKATHMCEVYTVHLFSHFEITFSLSQCTFIISFCQPYRELKKKRWIRLRNISSLQKTKKMQNHWTSLNSMYKSVYLSIHPSTYSPCIINLPPCLFVCLYQVSSAVVRGSSVLREGVLYSLPVQLHGVCYISSA